MDYSQYIRLKQEANNSYLARRKTLDASMITLKNQQRSAFAGAADLNTPLYYRGSPVVDPINDLSSNQFFTNGFRSSQNLSNDSLTNRRAGRVLASEIEYSTAPPGIELLNLSTAMTILRSYNNNSFVPSVIQNQVPVIRYVFPSNLASMYFNGNSFVRLSTDVVYPNTGANNDFTIEFFIKPSTNTSPVTQTVFFIGAPSSSDTYKFIGDLVMTVPGKQFTFDVKVSNVGNLRGGSLNADQWYHIAVMRFGNIMTLYINGMALSYLSVGNIPFSGSAPAGVTSFTPYLSGTESTAAIGGRYDGTYTFANGFIGNLTNFRWTKGYAVYTQSLGVPYVTTALNPFQVQYPPLGNIFDSGPRFVAVLLLAQSAASLITNTPSPTSTVSTTNGNTISGVYTAVSWQIT
jgi:hypothetical protein